MDERHINFGPVLSCVFNFFKLKKKKRKQERKTKKRGFWEESVDGTMLPESRDRTGNDYAVK